MLMSRLRNALASKLNQVAKKFLTPTEKEALRLGAYAREWVLSRNLRTADLEKFVPDAWFDDNFNLGMEQQLSWLQHWQGYADFFNELRADPDINKEFLGKSYLHNHYYPTPDAEIYACMLLDHKPHQIIEVGSGFSTLIARKTINAAGLKATITSIDPAPRSEIGKEADRLILQHVEDTPLDQLTFSENSLLFIDSSHICRGHGDVPFLFCKIMPRLPSGTLVHVHDIFLPYEYPTIFLDRLYTEQYLLYAILVNSSRYEILFTTHYMARKHPKEMQATFGDAVVGVNNRFFGSSFWFRVK